MGKQTLWERLTKGESVAEKEVYNPLELRVGAFLTLDLIEYRNKPPVKVVGIAEYTRTYRGAKLTFADYLLSDDSRLRVIPTNEVAKYGCPYHCYLLKQDAVEQWNQGLLDAVQDPTGVFNVHEGNLTTSYKRVNNLRTPFEVKVKELVDANGDKKIDDSEIHTRKVTYWDFYTDATDEAKQHYHRFFFVELCGDSKQFTMYIGSEIDPNRVSV